MSDDQAALLLKAKTSLWGARVLAEKGLFDYAVSRAYYTMFYVAEAFLLQDDLAFSRHAGVVAAFGEHFAKTGRVPREFHRYLIEGQDSRNIGDYDVKTQVSQQEATRQIDRAEQFIQLAERHLGPISAASTDKTPPPPQGR